MSPDTFKRQINRLAETFGANHYRPERIEVLWREVKDFSDQWLGRVVDKFIGELRQPPLLSEFRNEASIERERNWSVQKTVYKQDARDFYLILEDETVRSTIMKKIMQRMHGGVPDAEWDNFIKSLKKLVGEK